MKLYHNTTVTLTDEEIKAIEIVQHILNYDIDYDHLEGWLEFNGNGYDYGELSYFDDFLSDLLQANEE